MNLPQNKTSPILENPFFHRGPIRDRRYFFGRTKETRQALETLRNDQCVSIVGPRRIGETSLLFHLCDPEVQREHGLGEEYLFIYIDCQGLGDLDKPQFYQWLWQEAKRVLTERGQTDGWAEGISGFKEFREAMMTIQEKGYKPIFLFDEFETIAKNLNLDQALFSDLRSLVSTAIYATASQDSLYDLTYADKSVLSSPFFNVFSETHLGFLEPTEAKEMVGGLLRMVGQEDLFTEEDLAFVFEASGYHPFFLQLACYHLFKQTMERKDSTTADYERMRQSYAETTEAHFRYAWENLNLDEQEAVRLVCEGRVSQIDDEQKRRLEKRCILYGDAFFSSVFAEFARRQMKATAQIFLSYAREDEEKIQDLYQKLSGAGFTPWMDKKNILPGEIWKSSIRKAIQRSDFFLVCLSPNSTDKRGWIQREIKQALDIWQEKLEDDIYLIPVRMEDCEVIESLCDFQWVNLFEKDGWTQLMKAIQVGMERRT